MFSSPSTPDAAMDAFFSKERKPSSLGSGKANGNQYSPRKRGLGARAWPWHILSHILTLLWLAPAIILLYLNIKKKVIGNTLWCPKGHCAILGESQRSIQQALKYDRKDHDVNGALLFAQKGIEVWFTAVATLLVYDIAIMIARREGGLPVGYLLSHLEFTDPMNLLNSLVWKSASAKRSNSSSVSNNARNPRGWSLTLFAALITFLTILTNLMGPAGGVLVLPTVQWVDTKHEVQEQFHGLLSADPPSGNGTFDNCSAAELAEGKYSCTNYVYGPMLENIVSGIVANTRANSVPGKPALGDVVVSEALVQFTFDNGTSDDDSLAFVPNRQALRNLSSDVLTQSGFRPSTYTDSLEAIAHRSGPVFGAFAGFGIGDIEIVNVTTNKEVRCMKTWYDFSPDPPTAYTKCIRTGKGWSAVNEAAGFEIRNRTETKNDPGGDDDLLINIYFADKTTYFNESTDFGSGLGACVTKDDSYRDCDWDAIFSTQLPLKNLSRVSTNSLVVEIYQRNDEGRRATWVDFTSYLLWADYQVRLSPLENPVVVTTNTSIPDATTSKPIKIHPNWVLAAWSVNSTGVINGTSTIGSMFTNLYLRDIEKATDQVETGFAELVAVLFLSTAHTLSLIPYNSTNVHGTPDQALDKDAHYFYYWRSRRVWMYSLGSRTSLIGVVVVTIGMVVVVLRTLLAIYEKLRHNYSTRAVSPTELVVATLAHRYENEFDNNIMDEAASARVRYRIEDERGVLKFRPHRTETEY